MKRLRIAISNFVVELVTAVCAYTIQAAQLLTLLVHIPGLIRFIVLHIICIGLVYIGGAYCAD